MYTYLYDGTFDGLLTVYFYAYKDTQIYNICSALHHQPDLLSTVKEIHTETEKAERIRKSVYTKLSSTIMYNLYLLYLSELPNCDILGLQYLHLCYDNGIAINNAKHHPIVRKVEDYRYKVTRELDRMKGFPLWHMIGQSCILEACVGHEINKINQLFGIILFTKPTVETICVPST